jgi:translocation and assembly module TamB
LQIQNAELAAFVPLFPEVLSPEGELGLDVSLRQGTLEGELTIQGARTRPLATLGAIGDINVKAELVEHMLKLQSATARIGASTVNLAGQADLRGRNWITNLQPPFAFALWGTNVPLARQPESIIRSDLDLAIFRTNGATTVVSGKATLKNSFFMSDLSALVPGKVATPGRRPPYFSIEKAPLADWRLAVDVTGERCLNVRSTLFNGVASANLKIRGTLKEPVALGDLRIDSGVVRFPFASLQVQQGFVNTTSQDPYRPQLSISAASKQFGYDIKMDVGGPVDAPIIQFSSTPPLSSEQILLMVTSGAIPQGNYTLTPQQRAQTVGLFVGRDLLSKLGFGDSAEQRLTIRSGEEMTEQGTPTYDIEYKLTPRWSLTGERDRFNDYNAGVKWRVYSR